MQLFLTSLLVVIGTVTGQSAPADQLWERWKTNEPVVTFNPTTNLFTFLYDSMSNRNALNQIEFSFYDLRCKDDGTFTDPEYNLADAGLIAFQSSGIVNGYPEYAHRGDIPVLVNTNLYRSITAADPDGLIGQYGITTDDIGGGLLRFCVRMDVGYINSSNDLVSVNFRESIVALVFDLTVGFTVKTFNVAPKDRETNTQVKDLYNLIGYLCTDTTNLITVDGREVPPETTTYTGVNGNYFNQGALISICVRPDAYTVSDGIIITGINEYKWIRDDITPAIEQIAVPSTNGLTVSSCATSGAYCNLEGILYAEFYKSTGTVRGEGIGQLAFARRMLGAEEMGRVLEEEDSETSFDVQVDVTGSDDGPGRLRTAGGTTIGVTATAWISVMALVAGSILLWS